METNSLLMESGEKYVVLISKQSVEFPWSWRTFLWPCACVQMCVTIHIYVTYLSFYIKDDGPFSFLKYTGL